MKNNSWGYPLPVWYPTWVRIFWGNQVSPRQWLERAGFAVSWAWKLCCLVSCWWSAPRWRCLKIWKIIEKSVNFETCPKQHLGCCCLMSIPLKIFVDDPRWLIFNSSSSQTKRHNITQGWPPYGHKLGYKPSYAFLFGHFPTSNYRLGAHLAISFAKSVFTARHEAWQTTWAMKKNTWLFKLYRGIYPKKKQPV